MGEIDIRGEVNMLFLQNFDIVPRIFILTIMFLDIFQSDQLISSGLQFFLIIGFICLGVLDIWRRLFLRTIKHHKQVLLITLVLINLLTIKLPIGLTYLYVQIWDLIFLFGWPSSVYYVILYLLDSFLLWNYHTSEYQLTLLLTDQYWITHLNDILINSLSMIIITISGYLYYARFSEVRKTHRLNRQLQEANEKLRKYSEEIEELAIARERTRLAQEIHDSLGHSLAGMIMHLDFIEKVLDQDPKRAKEILIKTQNLARQGMTEVRQAVNALRESSIPQGLKASLEKLRENLQLENGLAVNLYLSPATEQLPPEIKSLIYKNVQEALTNSIKHGHCQNIEITLRITSDHLICIVHDDGEGCSLVNKSTGLLGIESRISEHGGQLRYNSKPDAGFTLSFELPIANVILAKEEE